MDVHQELERLLAVHQQALAGLDLEEAAAGLASYDRALREHIGLEETYVLPSYEKLIPDAVDAVLYHGEHRRLRLLLDEFRQRMQRLSQSATVRADVVDLFDREAMLKQILEHHDAREGNVLYPALDRLVDDEQRAAILGALSSAAPLPALPGDQPISGRPRRVVGVSIGLFLIAAKLDDGSVGIVDSPPAAGASEILDPEVLLGRDARELASKEGVSCPVRRALADAVHEALEGEGRFLFPDRLLGMVARGARREHLVRVISG